MIRKFLLGSAMAVALVAPALAQDQCVAPKAPAIPNGARATQTQIVAAQNDIKAFAAAADNYQACLAQELSHQKDLAKQNNSELDPGVQTALEAKGVAQRQDVQQVAAAWGTAVDAFNKAQERKQKQVTAPAAGGGGYGGGGYGGSGRY
jgi:hypothetical protein